MKELEIRVPQVPGASMGNPAHGKGHEEGGDMQRRDQASWGPPGRVTQISWFLSAYKSYVHPILQSIKCNSIMSKKSTYFNLKILDC